MNPLTSSLPCEHNPLPPPRAQTVHSKTLFGLYLRKYCLLGKILLIKIKEQKILYKNDSY